MEKHDALQKIAAAEQRDAAAAFEVGFAKAAQAAGLTEADFKAIYQIGCELLEQGE